MEEPEEEDDDEDREKSNFDGMNSPKVADDELAELNNDAEFMDEGF